MQVDMLSLNQIMIRTTGQRMEENGMAKADIIKFRELLLSDAELQEKLRKASEAYTGANDEKAVFENVLAPLAGEYGLSATYEEFKEYRVALSGGADGELSEDELTQVAGGKGTGAFICALLGVGAGNMGNPNDNCMFIGAGVGICTVEGASV